MLTMPNLNTETEFSNPDAPILVVENEDATLQRLSVAAREAGIGNRLIILPDMASAVRYLDGAGIYSNREKYPLPGIVLLDVTMPQLDNPQSVGWMTPPPVSRQIVVADICGATDHEQFISALNFGENALLCKLGPSEPLAILFQQMHRNLTEGKRLFAARAA
jgi:CheY-like chemotaxis protein